MSDASTYADPESPSLPASDVALGPGAALLLVDPQIDFLDPRGVAWGAVGTSVEEHGVVAHIAALLEAAEAASLPVFVSPHYYYRHDHGWRFEGPLERLMHQIGMFDRPSPYDLTGFAGSGADFLPQYKKHLDNDRTIVCSPHKVYGPENNDLLLQLRKRGVGQVVLAGMSANLCVQAHMHELLEHGFEVAVVRDATAGAKLPEGDGYLAALINFRYMANALWTTAEAVRRIAAWR